MGPFSEGSYFISTCQRKRALQQWKPNGSLLKEGRRLTVRIERKSRRLT